jgi:hypothetical protein
VLLVQLPDQVAQPGRRLGDDFADRPGRVLGDALQDGQGGTRPERRAAAHHLVQHALGRGGEEVAAVRPPGLIGRADQPQIRLVDQGGRLKGLVGGFLRHPPGGELPQLVIDEREQLGGGAAIAGRGGIQNAGDIRHSVE